MVNQTQKQQTQTQQLIFLVNQTQKQQTQTQISVRIQIQTQQSIFKKTYNPSSENPSPNTNPNPNLTTTTQSPTVIGIGIRASGDGYEELVCAKSDDLHRRFPYEGANIIDGLTDQLERYLRDGSASVERS